MSMKKERTVGKNQSQNRKRRLRVDPVIAERFGAAIAGGHMPADAYRVARPLTCQKMEEKLGAERAQRAISRAAASLRKHPLVEGWLAREQARIRVELANRRAKLLDGLERREILAGVARTTLHDVIDPETGRVRGDLPPEQARALRSIQVIESEDAQGRQRTNTKIVMEDKLAAVRLDAELAGELKQISEVRITPAQVMAALEATPEENGLNRSLPPALQ